MPTKKLNQSKLNEALLSAAEKGETDKVKELISKGADIQVKDNYDWTALHNASYNGYTETAKFLIKNGADINAKDNYGRTAENFARDKGYIKLADMLKNAERQKTLKETEEQLAHQNRIHDALRRNDPLTMTDSEFLDSLEAEAKNE